MQPLSISDIEEKYDLELPNILENIKKSKAKLALLQFADGLKPYATTIVDYLRENTDAEFLIWFETCYGACDTPVLSKDLEKQIDLVIQFGHSSLQPIY